jgi:DNA-binding MarR family transcriptional regulator
VPPLSDKSHSAETLTDLVLTLFRANNAMLVWGDRLVQPFGLTSARWQIMGAIAYADRPQPVAWLARDLGANRQNVQRIANDLEKEGLIAFEPNPHHKRAQLVVLTASGKHAYERAVEVWYSAADELAKELTQEEMAASVRVLKTLCGRLTMSNAGEDETVG